MGVSILKLLGSIQSLFLVGRAEICFNWSSFLGVVFPARAVTVGRIGSMRGYKTPGHFTFISTSWIQ